MQQNTSMVHKQLWMVTSMLYSCWMRVDRMLSSMQITTQHWTLFFHRQLTIFGPRKERPDLLIPNWLTSQKYHAESCNAYVSFPCNHTGIWVAGTPRSFSSERQNSGVQQVFDSHCSLMRILKRPEVSSINISHSHVPTFRYVLPSVFIPLAGLSSTVKPCNIRIGLIQALNRVARRSIHSLRNVEELKYYVCRYSGISSSKRAHTTFSLLIQEVVVIL